MPPTGGRFAYHTGSASLGAFTALLIQKRMHGMMYHIKYSETGPLFCRCFTERCMESVLSNSHAEDRQQRQNGVDYFLYLVYTKIEVKWCKKDIIQ